MADVRHGFLVLADISGFTAFVTATEIEHGPPIIAELLEEVIARLTPPLEVLGIEGDAVFAVGADGAVVPPAVLLEVLGAGFAGFRRRQQELERDDSCDCGACRGVGRLRLKIIGHWGAFLEHTVGGKPQVAGREVILAHRLLKNGWAREASYALLTRPALDRMAVDPVAAGLHPHVERFEHFGAVECFVQPVGPAPAGVDPAVAPAAEPAAPSQSRSLGV